VKAAAPEALASATGSPPSPASTPVQGVTIEGATYSQEAVARVLARLALVPALENVRLAATAVFDPATVETQPKVAKKVVTFTITASLRTGSSQ
jgi:hypothetical protein